MKIILRLFRLYMSKTVITDIKAIEVQTSMGSADKVRRPFSAAQISQTKSGNSQYKEEFFSIVRGMMIGAGFSFDRSFYTFRWAQPNSYTLILWARITWIDDSGEGKEVFMKHMRSTGLFKHGLIIVKAYS